MNATRTLAILSLVVVVAFAAACRPPAQRIGQTERITTVDQIDIQDWEEASRNMLDSLMTSGRLPEDETVLIQVSRIMNDTTERINTAHLTEYMLTELNRSGRAQALRWEEDPRIAPEAAARARRFDYTIGGRIIEQSARAGRTRQSTFVFTIWLNDPDTGASVWQEQTTIDKAGGRPAVGL